MDNLYWLLLLLTVILVVATRWRLRRDIKCLHRGHRWKAIADGWHCRRCGELRKIGDYL